MDTLQLSKRLQTVADRVPPCRVFADIGCDHGYLTAALLQRGIAQRAIASDVRKGPLKQAVQTIRHYGLEDRVDVRLSDGFQAFTPGEADAAAICGMGGMQICQILTEAPEGFLETLAVLIVQPQMDLAAVRHCLHEEGFLIEEEAFLTDRDKRYFVLKAVRGQEQYVNEFDYQYGVKLFQSKDPEYLLWLKERARKLRIWSRATKDAEQKARLLQEAEQIEQHIN